MPARVDIPVDELVDLIAKHRGNVSAIGRAKRLSRHTVQARIDESTTATRALADERESLVDDVEIALYDNALGGNVAAQIFVMKAHPAAKRRGWSERHEIGGPDGGPVQHEHRGQVHGEPEHLAAVLATLARSGAFQLPGAGDGDAAEDDGLHPA